MTDSSRRIGRTRARIVLAGVGLVLVLAAVAYAIAETARGPDRGKDGDRLAASSGGGLAIRADPLTRTVSPGERANFSLRILGSRGRRVRLSVVEPLPATATSSLSRRSTRSTRALLTIDTARAPSGGHRIRLVARRGRRRASAAVNLVITSAAEAGAKAEARTNFTISGDLAEPLAPGVTRPLDLALTNPGSSPIAITTLQVTIGSITAPRADDEHPCTLEDFSVAQFSGGYGFQLGPSQTSSLSELGFSTDELPRVTMLDRPVNQDGCKGASLQFSYSGASTGGS